LFHIDFGHILGDKIRLIDTAKFAITKDLEQVLGPLKFHTFIDLAVQAFAVLREHHVLVIHFLTNLFSCLPGLSSDRVREFLESSLLLTSTVDEACAVLKAKMFRAPTSLKTRIKNTIHALASS